MLDAELREDIEAIIEDMRGYKEDKAKAQRSIDDLNDEIADLEREKIKFEDQIEGLEDDIEGAEKSFMQLLREATEAGEDPADFARRALG